MRNLEDKIPGAPNFRYKEFVKSMTALRLGMSNLPTKESEWQAIEILAVEVLQPVRTKFGRINITSGFRSPFINKRIGGSTTSNHCLGQAADIEPLEVGVTLFDILQFIHNELPFRELIAEYFPNGWVHVAYRQYANNKTLKLKDDDHDFEKVDLDYISNIYRDNMSIVQ